MAYSIFNIWIASLSLALTGQAMTTVTTSEYIYVIARRSRGDPEKFFGNNLVFDGHQERYYEKKINNIRYFTDGADHLLRLPSLQR